MSALTPPPPDPTKTGKALAECTPVVWLVSQAEYEHVLELVNNPPQPTPALYALMAAAAAADGSKRAAGEAIETSADGAVTPRIPSE